MLCSSNESGLRWAGLLTIELFKDSFLCCWRFENVGFVVFVRFFVVVWWFAALSDSTLELLSECVSSCLSDRILQGARKILLCSLCYCWNKFLKRSVLCGSVEGSVSVGQNKLEFLSFVRCRRARCRTNARWSRRSTKPIRKFGRVLRSSPLFGRRSTRHPITPVKPGKSPLSIDRRDHVDFFLLLVLIGILLSFL